MRKVVATEFLSLDGVIEEPGWSLAYWSDEIAQFKQGELFESDALLLGRVTYDGFAQAWPSRTDEDGYADRMNAMPKYVVSTTLHAPEWNNTHVITDDIAGAVSRLKQQRGQNILIFGSGRLIRTLMQHDLIDEYRFLLYPVVLGKGKRLFEEPSNAKLKLVDSQVYSRGVLRVIYAPERTE